MGLYEYDSTDIPKSDRIPKLVENLYAKMPEIESARAVLLTESYRQTENEPLMIRRAKAFAHILENIPIVIRDLELIVGSSTIAPRGCQTFPEYSYEWLEAEFDTVETRSADPFYISEQTKRELKAVHPYWKGKTTSDLAAAYMEPETKMAMEHNMFTPGNYFYNGVGHLTVKYEEVLAIGFSGIREKAEAELASISLTDGNYQKKSRFLEAVIIRGCSPSMWWSLNVRVHPSTSLGHAHLGLCCSVSLGPHEAPLCSQSWWENQAQHGRVMAQQGSPGGAPSLLSPTPSMMQPSQGGRDQNGES